MVLYIRIKDYSTLGMSIRMRGGIIFLMKKANKMFRKLNDATIKEIRLWVKTLKGSFTNLYGMELVEGLYNHVLFANYQDALAVIDMSCCEDLSSRTLLFECPVGIALVDHSPNTVPVDKEYEDLLDPDDFPAAILTGAFHSTGMAELRLHCESSRSEITRELDLLEGLIRYLHRHGISFINNTSVLETDCPAGPKRITWKEAVEALRFFDKIPATLRGDVAFIPNVDEIKLKPNGRHEKIRLGG